MREKVFALTTNVHTLAGASSKKDICWLMVFVFAEALSSLLLHFMGLAICLKPWLDSMKMLCNAFCRKSLESVNGILGNNCSSMGAIKTCGQCLGVIMLCSLYAFEVEVTSKEFFISWIIKKTPWSH